MDLIAIALPPLSQSTSVSISGIPYDRLTQEEIKGGHSLHMVLEIFWHHLKCMTAIPKLHTGAFLKNKDKGKSQWEEF